MRSLLRSRCALAATAFSCLLCISSTADAQPKLPQPDNQVRNRGNADRGQQLFNHCWEKNDQLSHAGDGLGPMFNAVSCRNCHLQGGTGGGGPADVNVHVLNFLGPLDQRVEPLGGLIVRPIAALHPAFDPDGDGKVNTRSVVLHADSTDVDYAAWRHELLNSDRKAKVRGATRKPLVVLRREIEGRPFLLTQRNTPALFGVGLIDSISKSDLRAIEQEQARRRDGISGRVAETAEGEAGKFGWRGQIATLDEFVLMACAVEVGLDVPTRRQSVNPLQPKDGPKGLDLSEGQCDDLVAFVASLPPPRALVAPDAQQAALVKNGEGLFTSIGCTACHLPQLDDVEGIYSDLLLHDLGFGLAEAVPVEPQIRKFRDVGDGGGWGADRRGGVGCGGVAPAEEFVYVDGPSNKEWRTPPLWGVRDSAPYLHDGRASTLAEAIVLHGGEAAASAKRFRALPLDAQQRLIAFVQSLGAPK